MQPIIIVEGTNYSGKSTLFRSLKRATPGCLAIELHGCFVSQQRNGCPPSEVLTYADRRLNQLVDIAEQHPYDAVLFERLHGTEQMYRQLLLDIHTDYEHLEQRLNALNALLVVCTIDDDTLQNRMSTSDKIWRNSPNSPSHMTDWDTLRRKRDLYLSFYSGSTMDNKKLIHSDNETDPELTAREILEEYAKA